MNYDVFNPEEWLTLAPIAADSSFGSHLPTQLAAFGSDARANTEALVNAVEASGIDITVEYLDWLHIAFALCDEFGREGENYFLRLSRFNPEYNESAARQQYARCLAHKGKGITIASLFFIAKKHGINLPTQNATQTNPAFHPSRFSQDFPVSAKNIVAEIAETAETAEKPLPCFSQSVKEYLPSILQDVIADAISDADADLLILGALTTFSACIPNVFGIYDKREVFANLFLFVTARASAGKGRLSLCRHLAAPLHQALRDKYKKQMEKYEAAQASYAANRKNSLEAQPKEPPFLTLFVPANSTATVVYQTLAENNGVGLLFETEGDTLANAFNSDLGNYSDGFRKAFHHETISYLRKKDHEYVEILRPKFSAILSGTPQQIFNLIPDTENGLFSRFVFYSMPTQLVWHDIFAASDGSTADDRFKGIGERFYKFQKVLSRTRFVQFTFTKEQQAKFNDFFAATQTEYAGRYGDEIIASVRRFGLILFRFAMVLSVLRLMDDKATAVIPAKAGISKIPSQLICSDTDFNTALTMVKALLCHTVSVFRTIPAKPSLRVRQHCTENTRQRFLDALPFSFDRPGYMQTAASIGINVRTAERYINDLCDSGKLIHQSQGSYQKNTSKP